MDIFVNERSFENQAKYFTVITLMRQFVETLHLLSIICDDAEIVIHSTLSSRRLGENQTLAAWLSSSEEDDDQPDQAAEQSQSPFRQAIIGTLLAALARGPYVEDLLSECQHACYLGQEDHDWSAVAAAAYLGGVVVSLDGHPSYPDGALTVYLSRDGGDFMETGVAHFVTLAEARKCRRRYVPNPKHHPDRAQGNRTKMELDREYDPYSPEKEQALRDMESDSPDTAVQQLLDSALPGGKQLYAVVYTRQGRDEQFYEFMDDNMNGFHGYPVGSAEVPADVVRQLRERDGRNWG